VNTNVSIFDLENEISNRTGIERSLFVVPGTKIVSFMFRAARLGYRQPTAKRFDDNKSNKSDNHQAIETGTGIKK
jgi:hypothetical protein